MLYGQGFDCDTLVEDHHYCPFDPQGIRTTKDYIARKYPRLREHIGNRATLPKVNLLIDRNDDSYFFSNRKVAIQIKCKKIIVDSISKYFYPTDGEDENYLSFINDPSAPFGITIKDKIIEVIDSIKINENQVPPEAFQNLYNINRTETLFAVKPLEVFTSANGKFIYLYVFGKLRIDLTSVQNAARFSYMAKLIFTTEGQYLGRIVESGSTLKYFGFALCDQFIGF